MNFGLKAVSLLGSLVVAAAALTACGGDDAPKATSRPAGGSVPTAAATSGGTGAPTVRPSAAAPTDAPTSAFDACAAVPKAEVEKAFGYTVSQVRITTAGVTSCRYENTEFGKAFVTISFNPAVADRASWDTMIKTLGIDKDLKPLAGLGDAALAGVTKGTSPQAEVWTFIAKRKGSLTVAYSSGQGQPATEASVAKLTELARLVLAKA